MSILKSGKTMPFNNPRTNLVDPFCLHNLSGSFWKFLDDPISASIFVSDQKLASYRLLLLGDLVQQLSNRRLKSEIRPT